MGCGSSGTYIEHNPGGLAREFFVEGARGGLSGAGGTARVWWQSWDHPQELARQTRPDAPWPGQDLTIPHNPACDGVLLQTEQTTLHEGPGPCPQTVVDQFECRLPSLVHLAGSSDALPHTTSWPAKARRPRLAAGAWQQRFATSRPRQQFAGGGIAPARTEDETRHYFRRPVTAGCWCYFARSQKRTFASGGRGCQAAKTSTFLRAAAASNALSQDANAIRLRTASSR